MRLLIVNAFDERDMYAEAFRGHGFTVKTAPSAREALAAARRQKPDAIVVGALLPDLSGAELVKRLKAELAPIPVVLLTGFSDPQHGAAFRASGADLIVLKPCLPDDLLARVRELLRPGKSRPAPANAPRSRARPGRKGGPSAA